MSHVTAEYSLLEDGGIRVINRGYDTGSGEWKEAEGKAYFVGSRDEGHLKVQSSHRATSTFYRSVIGVSRWLK